MAPLEFWHSTSRSSAVVWLYSSAPPTPPALNASDSETLHAVVAESEPATAAAANDFSRAVSTSGSVAAHPSAVACSVFLFLCVFFFLLLSSFCPDRSSLALLSMQDLVSFAEPQPIKGIPGDVEVTSVSPGYKVLTVCPQSERSSLLLFCCLANKLEPNWCPRLSRSSSKNPNHLLWS